MRPAIWPLVAIALVYKWALGFLNKPITSLLAPDVSALVPLLRCLVLQGTQHIPVSKVLGVGV